MDRPGEKVSHIMVHVHACATTDKLTDPSAVGYFIAIIISQPLQYGTKIVTPIAFYDCSPLDLPSLLVDNYVGPSIATARCHPPFSAACASNHIILIYSPEYFNFFFIRKWNIKKIWVGWAR